MNAQHNGSLDGSGRDRTFRLPSFEEAVDIREEVDRRRRIRRQMSVIKAFIVIFLIASVTAAGIPFTLQYLSSRQLSTVADTAQKHVEGWPYPQAEEALKAAHRYNRELARSGQPVLGEAADPFTSASGGSSVSGKDAASETDRNYQSQLNSGDGVMGTIRIPKIGVKLPIYHGTSDQSLASGAGHLYGTSLPVGGKSTHAVITGHRGLVRAEMFTRLNEMSKGDFFYIEVMGVTKAYKVDRITVIDPDDSSRLRIVKGEDRVTLMTCTPYGVNTHRLLVSGHRVSMPVPAPDPDTLFDVETVTKWLVGGLLGIGLLIVVSWRRRTGWWHHMRHAAAWPQDMGRMGIHGSSLMKCAHEAKSRL